MPKMIAWATVAIIIHNAVVRSLKIRMWHLELR